MSSTSDAARAAASGAAGPAASLTSGDASSSPAASSARSASSNAADAPEATDARTRAPLDETVEVYSSRFRLTREVTLLDTPEARKALAGRSSVTVAGRLEYQACDDKVCYSPGKVPVSFVVSLK